jgi:chaperonin GroES
MAYRPYHDYIFIEPDEVQDKTESGIILAPQAITKPTTGTVYDVGPDVEDKVKVGARVIFLQHHGEPLGDLLYMRFASLIAYED